MGEAVSKEEEEIILKELAQKIHNRGLDTTAVLLLESSKPLVWIAGELGRFFVSPFLPIFNDDYGDKTDKMITILEKRKNIDRLMELIEILEEEDKKKKEEKNKKLGIKPPH